MPGTVTGEMSVGWVLTHGVNMAWRYAISVQPALDDMTAALELGDWPLCVESAGMALRAMVFCHHVGDGVSGSPSELELHLRVVTDPNPAARALLSLPWSADAGEEDAHRCAEVVRQHDESLRQSLPFEMPVIRAASGYAPSMRVNIDISRWRSERGMGPLYWNRSGI